MGTSWWVFLQVLFEPGRTIIFEKSTSEKTDLNQYKSFEWHNTKQKTKLKTVERYFDLKGCLNKAFQPELIFYFPS